MQVNKFDIWFPEHLPPVVLDSSMLGVLPAPSELRRMLTPHAHPHEPVPNPYAPLPVDPLVVNFEEGMRLYWNYMY